MPGFWINDALGLPPGVRGRRARRLARDATRRTPVPDLSLVTSTRPPARSRWPIWGGDIWRVGPHVLACGDLEMGHAVKLLNTLGAHPDLVVTTPPGTARVAALDRRHAKLPQNVDFPAFLSKLAHAVLRANAPAAIVFPAAGQTDLLRMMGRAGMDPAGRWCLTDRTDLHLFISPGHRPLSASGTVDPADLTATVIAAYTQPGGLVFDPLMGRGETAIAAARLGRSCVGMEINPLRVSVAVSALVDLLDVDPERLGNLL